LKRPVPSTLSDRVDEPGDVGVADDGGEHVGVAVAEDAGAHVAPAQLDEDGAVLGKEREPLVAGHQLALGVGVEREAEAARRVAQPRRVQSRKLRGRPLIELSRVYSICLSRQRMPGARHGPGNSRSATAPTLIDVEERAVRVEQYGPRRVARRGCHGANLCEAPRIEATPRAKEEWPRTADPEPTAPAGSAAAGRRRDFTPAVLRLGVSHALLGEARLGSAGQLLLGRLGLARRHGAAAGVGLALLDEAGLRRAASFFSAALASHDAEALAPASASHFLTKLVFAAPASFFSAAFVSQLPWHRLPWRRSRPCRELPCARWRRPTSRSPGRGPRTV
jgi:hypothetical protein